MSPSHNKRKRSTKYDSLAEPSSGSSDAVGEPKPGQGLLDIPLLSPESYLETNRYYDSSSRTFGARMLNSYGDHSTTPYDSNSETAEGERFYSLTTPSPMAPTQSTPDLPDDLNYEHHCSPNQSQNPVALSLDWPPSLIDHTFATGAWFLEDAGFDLAHGDTPHPQDLHSNDVSPDGDQYNGTNPILSFTHADPLEHSPVTEQDSTVDYRQPNEAFRRSEKARAITDPHNHRSE